jgi:signal transduction histidine kinase
MLRRLKSYLNSFKLLRSLQVRFFLIILMAGIIPSIIMHYGVLQSYESRAVSLRTSDVQNQFLIIANHLINNNYLQDTSSEVINAELDQLSSLYNGRVLIIDQNFKVIKDTYGLSEGKTIISEEVMKCFNGESNTYYDDINSYIEVATPIVTTSTTDLGGAGTEDVTSNKQKEYTIVKGVILTSASTDYIDSTLNILKRRAFLLEFVVVIIIIGISVSASKLMTKPFANITTSINEIKEGFNYEQISMKGYWETEQIIEAFNQLLGRMKILDDSRQEFVSNVSHELKTPITSMKVLADALLTQENVPNELYREFMEDITDEIERENKIINDLLALVKMDKTAADLNIESIDVNALVELILKRLKPIARQHNIELVFESIRPVVANIDEVKMTLAISNLVENAIKYNREDGWVKVTLDADHQFFTITVEDSGIGIPDESLEHIYERFYRVDKSHSREIGGTGLGLSITRGTVLMHRGSVKVSSVENVGTKFTVKIPLTYSM